MALNSLATTQPANQAPTGNLYMSPTGATYSNEANYKAGEIASGGQMYSNQPNAGGGKVSINNPTGTYPGIATPSSSQSTTTLSSNKTSDILNTTNGINNMQTGVTTNPTSGVSTYANGSVYTPPGTDTSAEDSTIDSLLKEMLARTDADTANSIQSIQNKFAGLKLQQEQVNKGNEAASQGALFRSGAAQGDAYSNNTQGYQVQQSLNALNALDMQQLDAINAAKAAQSAGYQRVAELKYNEALDAKKRKLELADKINEEARQAQVAAVSAAAQAKKDSAISDLYTSGVTNTSDIIKTLKNQGITATSADVSATLKNTGVEDINKIAQEAAKNGAPLSIINAIGSAKSPIEATLAAGKYASDPLDREYKLAQINKINQDIKDSGTNADPSSVLAYAQQYASTGTIPTGLPKGTFGLVSQVAKELPKNPGTLVDNNTGIKSSKISATEETGISSLYDLSKKIDDAKELYSKNGVVNRVEYNTLRSEIVDLLARARTGAAISASEEALYKGKIPNITWSIKPFGDIKLDGLKSSIEGKLDTTLQANGVSIYGYTKVNTPLGDKTVGDTITLPNGASGRINPDGTITSLN